MKVSLLLQRGGAADPRAGVDRWDQLASLRSLVFPALPWRYCARGSRQSPVLVLGGVETRLDEFERSELGSDWTSVEGLVISDGQVELAPTRAVGRAAWQETPEPEADKACLVSVKVTLSDIPEKSKRYARACVRMVRGTSVAYARVTVWWDPRLPEKKLKVECGVVGSPGDREEETVAFNGPAEEELELEFKGVSGELRASFGNIAKADVPFDLGTGTTQFLIEAGGDSSLVKLDDFEATWKEP